MGKRTPSSFLGNDAHTHTTEWTSYGEKLDQGEVNGATSDFIDFINKFGFYMSFLRRSSWGYPLQGLITSARELHWFAAEKPIIPVCRVAPNHAPKCGSQNWATPFYYCHSIQWYIAYITNKFEFGAPIVSVDPTGLHHGITRSFPKTGPKKLLKRCNVPELHHKCPCFGWFWDDFGVPPHTLSLSPHCPLLLRTAVPGIHRSAPSHLTNCDHCSEGWGWGWGCCGCWRDLCCGCWRDRSCFSKDRP